MYPYLLCGEVTLLNPNSIRYGFAFNALVAKQQEALGISEPYPYPAGSPKSCPRAKRRSEKRIPAMEIMHKFL